VLRNEIRVDQMRTEEIMRAPTCMIVVGGIGAKLGYALGKFGSEQILEVVVVGRDASADRSSPMITAIPGFRKARSWISVLPVGDHRFDD